MQFEVLICGETWQVQFRPPSRMPLNKTTGVRDWGICDWSRRLILVNKSLTVEQQARTLMHEIQHAHNPHHREEAVETFEQSVAEAFGKAGFKITRMAE